MPTAAASPQPEVPASQGSAAAYVLSGMGAVQPARIDDRQRTRVAALSAELLDLDASELESAATVHRSVSERDLVLAIVLRAGRPVPPGLSTARRGQRAERAAEGLAWLRRELGAEAAQGTEPRFAGPVSGALAAVLSGDQGAGLRAPELEIAAMNVVADLDLVAFTPSVATYLGESTEPSMRAAARGALFRMYGRWFSDVADFRSRWVSLEGLMPAATGRDDLRAAVEVANARALSLIERAPDTLQQGPNPRGLLEWDDPAMVTRAAQAVGRAVVARTLSPEEARAAFMSSLSSVVDAHALDACLRGLLDLTQGVDPRGKLAVDVRELVSDLAGDAGLAPERTFVLISGLPRLPYSNGPDGDPERVAALQAGIRALQGTIRRNGARTLDPDGLQSSVEAVRDLARSITHEDSRDAASRPLVALARQLVLAVDLPLRVRRAGAETLSLASAPGEARRLVSLVRSMDGQELEYELLGALKSVVGALRPSSPAAEGVVSQLLEAAADPRFDRRKRALDLLLSDDLRGAIGARPRPTTARWLALRVGAEPSNELRAKLLGLGARIGDPVALDLLLADAQGITELASSSPEVASALSGLVKAVSSDEVGGGDGTTLVDGTVAMAVAKAIAGPVGGDAGSVDLEQLDRGRVALDLVLSLGAGAAAGLQPDQHGWIIDLVLRVRRAVPAAFVGPGSAQDLERVLGVHVPGAGAAHAASARLATALLSGDRLRTEIAGTIDLLPAGDPRLQRVLDAFDAAGTETVPSDQEGSAPDLAYEAAALLVDVGQIPLAILRLERALGGEENACRSRVVRRFAQLVLRAEASGLDRRDSRIEVAAETLLGLTRSDEWSSTDPAIRLADLTSLTELLDKLPEGALRARLATWFRAAFLDDSTEAAALRTELSLVGEEAVQALASRAREAIGLKGSTEPAGNTPKDR